MKIRICTPVAYQPAPQILQGFDERLFQKLNPPFPFPPVRIVRFDGCKTGDLVQLELNFFVFRAAWTSQIMEAQISENRCFFVDKGTKLPFFLSSWHHTHIIESDLAAGHSRIIDDIEYKAAYNLSFLLWPMMYLQFAFRKPVYQRVFGKYGVDRIVKMNQYHK